MGGAMAFHITKGGNRFSGCYIDGGRAVFEGAGLKNNIWTNGFACCANVGGVNWGIILKGDDIGPGLHFSHNIFQSDSFIHHESTSAIAEDNRSKAFVATKVVDVRVEDNYFAGRGRGTRASLTQGVTKSRKTVFDFCDQLIFPRIETTRVSLAAAE